MSLINAFVYMIPTHSIKWRVFSFFIFIFIFNFWVVVQMSRIHPKGKGKVLVFLNQFQVSRQQDKKYLPFLQSSVIIFMESDAVHSECQ